MTKEEIKKHVEELVEAELTKSKESGEDVKKAVDTNTDKDENGGKDKIKSGTPMTEKQAMMDKKMKKAEDEDSEDPVEKANDYDDKDKDDKDKNDAKKKMKKNYSMKKSEENSDEDSKEDVKKAEDAVAESKDEDDEIGKLSSEEVELVKAWRSQPKEDEKEDVQKTQPKEDQEDIKKALDAQKEENEALKKSLADTQEILKSMNDKIEKISTQPAYDKRALDKLEPIEKSGSNEPTNLSKYQISQRMLDLQIAGKGVTSKHVAEFEATGNVSDRAIKQLVMDSFKN